MAEINELFEEGITRSRELADAADEAMDAIDDMAKEAEDLAQRVQDEGSEACRHMRDLAARLEQAEGELETAGGQAQGALAGLAAAAEKLESEAAELLARVSKSLAEEESRKEQLDGSLDTQMAATEQDFQDLARRTQEAQGLAEQHLQEAAQSIAALRSAVENARAEFAGKQEAWGATLDALELAARERADEWVGRLNDLLARQSAALVEAANAMVDHHNDAMDGLKERFVQQAPQDMSAALEPVVAALTKMGEDAGDPPEALSGNARGMQEWVDMTLPSLTVIQAALDSAARLE